MDEAPFHLRVASPSPSPYVKRPWKKLLYLQQAYPDNYTDSSFLSQLKRNTTVAKYSLRNLVGDFSLIVLHLSLIMLVVLMFAGIHLHHWSLSIPTATTTVITTVGILYFYQRRIKSYVITAMLLLVLSPVMKSLTRSTASDSIWALSFCLVLANTIFHDYAFAGDPTKYQPILSTNISLTNAIVLASRLTTNTEVFLFMMLAIEISILFPLIDVSIRHRHWQHLHSTIFTVIFVLDCWLLWKLIGFKYVGFWVCGCMAIMFGMPSFFLFLQRYKNEMMGPWDPAKPKFSTRD